MSTVICKIKPYIQPFERQLALSELASLVQSSPKPIDSDTSDSTLFEVNATQSTSLLIDRLSYWETVTTKREYYTAQVLREATVNVVRNGVAPLDILKSLPFGQDVPVPNRRVLRYGSHGIHEYRGKFFPQLVRALLNCANVREGSLVADPMVGSGTTAVECTLSGINSLGADLNPLSALIADTKCSILWEGTDELRTCYERVRKQLSASNAPYRRSEWQYLSCLSLLDQAYLRDWFSEQVLLDLDTIAGVIASERNDTLQSFLNVVLSNILRSVSWQKDSDLRVRKEVRSDIEIDAIREYLNELGRSVRLVLALMHQINRNNLGHHTIEIGDARTIDKQWANYQGAVDAIITSPPYASALPYLDTDRLSLCLLGLMQKRDLRRAEGHMIGNREITESMRQQLEAMFEQRDAEMPRSVIRVVTSIHRLNSKGDIGFRRRNTAALLGKYFVDMKEVLSGLRHLLTRKGSLFLVIGNNHTIAGGTRVDIPTADLLHDIAEASGFQLTERIPMEMLVSRNIFKKNAVASETILRFKRS